MAPIGSPLIALMAMVPPVLAPSPASSTPRSCKKANIISRILLSIRYSVISTPSPSPSVPTHCCRPWLPADPLTRQSRPSLAAVTRCVPITTPLASITLSRPTAYPLPCRSLLPLAAVDRGCRLLSKWHIVGEALTIVAHVLSIPSPEEHDLRLLRKALFSERY